MARNFVSIPMNDPTPFDTAWRKRAEMEAKTGRKYVIAEHMITGMHAVIDTALWNSDATGRSNYLLADRAR